MLGLLQIIFITQYVVQAFNTPKIEELKFGKKAIFRQARVRVGMGWKVIDHFPFAPNVQWGVLCVNNYDYAGS